MSIFALSFSCRDHFGACSLILQIRRNPSRSSGDDAGAWSEKRKRASFLLDGVFMWR